MDLRSRVLHHLATPHAETRFGYSYLVGSVSRSASCRPHEVWEALWGLVGEGLVYLDPDIQGSGTDNWHWRLSAVGIQATSGGTWEPRDPEGYLKRLRTYSPAVDPLAIIYVEEALRAFNARCFLATSVMLGVASERAVGVLALSAVDALDERAGKLATVLQNPKSSQVVRFTELRKLLEPLRPELPVGTADTLTLDAVADLLRITRNDAGHPTGARIDEDTAYTHLQIAARYLQKMAVLQNHFENP